MSSITNERVQLLSIFIIYIYKFSLRPWNYYMFSVGDLFFLNIYNLYTYNKQMFIIIFLQTVTENDETILWWNPNAMIST